MTEIGCTKALGSLGFNALEASVYAFLLRESPVTGYRVAQALGKPVANTYKAIESLSNKGAVIVNDGVDDGSNRLCRPVPPKELLGQMERDFHARQSQAAEALARVHRETSDDGVYQLKSVEQVMERCRAMLDRCTAIWRWHRVSSGGQDRPEKARFGREDAPPDPNSWCHFAPSIGTPVASLASCVRLVLGQVLSAMGERNVWERLASLRKNGSNF